MLLFGDWGRTADLPIEKVCCNASENRGFRHWFTILNEIRKVRRKGTTTLSKSTLTVEFLRRTGNSSMSSVKSLQC
jgi:hypothetical protein